MPTVRRTVAVPYRLDILCDCGSVMNRRDPNSSQGMRTTLVARTCEWYICPDCGAKEKRPLGEIYPTIVFEEAGPE